MWKLQLPVSRSWSFVIWVPKLELGNQRNGVSKGVVSIELDGVPQSGGGGIPLLHDRKKHQVLVVMG